MGSLRQVRVAAGLVAGGLLIASAAGVSSAQAVAGCSVDYEVASQWPGGFVANVSVTNLGDAVSSWVVTWSFANGQTVSSAWNAAVTQNGPDVTAKSLSYNGPLGTNASTGFGFQGTWADANAVPTSFTLNGAACGGTTTPSPTAPPTPTPTPTPTATPTSTVTAGTPTVAADGTGNYRTVQAAVDAVPAGNPSRVTITIKPGAYREIVTIPSNKPYITLQGLGSTAGSTVIVNNHSNAAGYGTFGSATVFVQADDFTATNLTMSNDYGEGSQAVAANLDADRLVLDNVRFLGNQDTLLVQAAARVYVRNSFIEGTVDFIFGDGTAVFDSCQIYQRRSSGGPITAARTPAGQTYGFLVYRSTITGAAPNVTTLGRPWGPDAQVLFRESSLSDTIRTAQPWMDMSSNSWRNARFFEYGNTGAGAGTGTNRPHLSDAAAADYTPQKYLAGPDGWNPIG